MNPQLIKNKPRDELLQFCSKPIPNHFLVIIMDDFYSQLKIAKVLQKELVPIDVRKPFEKELRSWTKRFFDDQGIDAPPSVVQAVLEIAGDSVYHIANQVEKICLGLGENDILTPEVVQKFSGWNREYQKWEFLNAVGQRDLPKALLTGNNYISRNEMISLLPNLTALFQEMLFIHMDNGTSQPFRGYIPLTNGVKNKLPAHAKKYTKEEIENSLALLGDIDRSIKTTSENDESLLTRFLFNTIIEHD
jgi:DNA polymerase III delta subunit